MHRFGPPNLDVDECFTHLEQSDPDVAECVARVAAKRLSASEVKLSHWPAGRLARPLLFSEVEECFTVLKHCTLKLTIVYTFEALGPKVDECVALFAALDTASHF